MLCLVLTGMGYAVYRESQDVDRNRYCAMYHGEGYSGYSMGIRNKDGTEFKIPTVPAGQDYVDSETIADEIDTYDKGKTNWAVRIYSHQRTYRPGAKGMFNGKEEVFEKGACIVISSRKVYLGPANKVCPEALVKCKAVRRLFDYEKWGTDPQLEEQIMREAGVR